jgi:apolipoprotein N-acyltransferase
VRLRGQTPRSRLTAAGSTFASVEGVTLRLASAATAGLALSYAYAPTGWWWLAAPAIAVLTLACFRLPPWRSFAVGTVFGLACCLPLLEWLAAVIGRDAGLGLAGYTALWFGLTGVVIGLVTRLPMWWLIVPCGWIAVEAIGGRIPFGGWGWTRVGFSQDGSPLLPVAALAGVPGLGFATVLVGAAGAAVVRVAWSMRRQDAPQPLRPMAGPLIGLAALVLLVAVVPVPVGPQDDGGPPSMQVGLVQGNVPQAGLDFNEQRRAVLDQHVEQTELLADDVAAGKWAQPDLVLWPENASDIDPFRNADARAAIDRAVEAVGVPLLVGAVVGDPTDPTKVYNQGIVWDPETGPGAVYTKRNLVPFGEYVPFREVLAPLISRFDRVPRDFVPGTEPGGLAIAGTRIGNTICFDIAFDDTVRDAVRDGGRMLVVQTNNATYNGTDQPWQQFAMSRIRAVEHGRAVAVVSTSGLSGVIAPDGSLVPATAIGELQAGRYVVQIPQRDARTVADRVGAAPEWLALLVAAAGAAMGARRRGDTGSAAAVTVGEGGVEPVGHDTRWGQHE